MGDGGIGGGRGERKGLDSFRIGVGCQKIPSYH